MGFLDRLTGKKPAPTTAPGVTASPAPQADPAAAPAVAASPAATAGGVMPRLAAAREKLEAKDLPAALVIYEEVLALAGDRADVLVTISGAPASGDDVAGYFEPEEWEAAKHDDISLQEVRRALSSITGSLADAVIASREER